MQDYNVDINCKTERGQKTPLIMAAIDNQVYVFFILYFLQPTNKQKVL